MKEEQTPEMLELLKRAEIRTMAKDIAMIREKEALKERERIAALRISHEQAPNLSPVNAFPVSAPATLTETLKNITLPRPPSSIQKRVARVLLGSIAVLTILNMILFVYWYLTQRAL